MPAVVDEKGRIVLPKHLREQAGLTPGTPVHFEIDRDAITIRPAHDRRERRLEALRRIRGIVNDKTRRPDAPLYDAETLKREVWGDRI